MKANFASYLIISLALINCQRNSYTEEDFSSVLKIDSHIHINSDKGYFEDQAIEFIKSRNLPITGHLGEPRNCWLPLAEMTVRSDSSYFASNPQYHMFLHPEYPSYEDQVNARDHLLEKNPDLKFIGCHLGSLEWNVDSLAKRLDKFPNMVVDMSARICHLQYQSAQDRKKVRDFCIKYQDRLLYGTDVGDNGTADPEGFKKRMHETWLDDWKYFATKTEITSTRFDGKFEGLQLPKKVVDKIFNENAIKWYKLRIASADLTASSSLRSVGFAELAKD